MSRPVAALTLLLVTMIWGFAFLAQKSAMATMGPLTFAGSRYLLGGLVLLPFALSEYRRKTGSGAAKPLGRHEWLVICTMSLVFFLGSWLQQSGLATTTVTNAGFLTGLYVLFVPLIAFLVVRARPHAILYVSVPLALVGLFLLNGGHLDRFNSGDGLVIFSAVFWACHVLLIGYLARRTGLPVFISAVSFIVAAGLALCLAVVIETPSLAGISAGWKEIAYAGLLSTAVAYTLQAVAQQYVPPANAAIILSAESLFAALGGAIVLGERLPPIGYAGAALMFGAILLVEAVPAMKAARNRAASSAPAETT